MGTKSARMVIIDPAALHLAAVVESSDDAIISQTIDGVIGTWNRAAEQMFGYTPEEAIGRPITLIVPPDRREEERDITARLLSGDIIRHFETVGRTKSNQPLPVSVTMSRLVTPDGETIGISRIIRDVSGQRVLEREALRLAAVVNSSEDAIVSKDLNGIVLTWNPAAERMFGYTAEEMVGRSIRTIIPPERLSEEDHVLGQIRAGIPIQHFETVRCHKSGARLNISLSVSPVRTAAGVIIGASKIARDITKQKALEREALRLAAVVNSSEDAIVSKDLNGIVQTWNNAAERMFGYSADEMIGRPISVIIPPERWQEEDDVLAKVREGKRIDHFETLRRRKDGALIEISLSVSPIRTPDGAIIGASKIARDITTQRRLAREAEEANRVKDEFLAMLSHELRTPLNAVVGYTRMLRMGHFAGERRDRAMEIIERNANILSQLVSDVLDVSSIVTGKIQLKPALCDLGLMIAAATDIVRPAADAKSVALHFDAPGEPVRGRYDADRLQQVFWNLLSNAVKFTPRGGTIAVRLAADNGFAEATVTDTGIGITADALPYLFQRFWQADRPESRQVGSLGLGLALARHFVELHGGTISASSPGEGRGSTFTVRLPLTDVPPFTNASDRRS